MRGEFRIPHGHTPLQGAPETARRQDRAGPSNLVDFEPGFGYNTLREGSFMTWRPPDAR